VSRVATGASGAGGVRRFFSNGGSRLLRRVRPICPPTSWLVARDRRRTTPIYAQKASDRSQMKSLPLLSRPICPPLNWSVTRELPRTARIHVQKASAHNRITNLPCPRSRLICPATNQAAPACPSRRRRASGTTAGASPRQPRQPRPDRPMFGLRQTPRPSRSVKVDGPGGAPLGAPLSRSVAPGRDDARGPSAMERPLRSHRAKPALPRTCLSHLHAPALLPKPFLPRPGFPEPLRPASSAPDPA
jgi:hypothetical protein